jgi:hypothetical protein
MLYSHLQHETIAAFFFPARVQGFRFGMDPERGPDCPMMKKNTIWFRQPPGWIHAFLLLAMVAAVVFVQFEILDTPLYWASNGSAPLGQDDVVAQTFLVRGPLSRLSLLCGTGTQPLQGTIQLVLVNETGAAVWTKSFPGKMVIDNRFTDFPVDRACPGGVYRLEIRYRQTAPEDRFSLYWNRRGGYPGGESFWNGRYRPGSVVFRAYYRTGFLSGMGIFLKRASLLPPLATALLLGLFAGLTCFILAGLIGGLRRRPPIPEKE